MSVVDDEARLPNACVSRFTIRDAMLYAGDFDSIDAMHEPALFEMLIRADDLVRNEKNVSMTEKSEASPDLAHLGGGVWGAKARIRIRVRDVGDPTHGIARVLKSRHVSRLVVCAVVFEIRK